MQLFEKITNAVGDFRLGIRAGGTAPSNKEGGVYYASMGHSLIREVLDRLQLRAEDNFLDIGCGKGRVLAVAAGYPVYSILGVEYEPTLYEVAKTNLAGYHRVGVTCGAAEKLDYSQVSVAYAFNPVEPAILDLVLKQIEKTRRGNFRMAYVSGNAAHDAVYDRHAWLTRYEEFKTSVGHTACLYRTTA